MLVQRDREWWEQALCAQTDPETFFPVPGGNPKAAKMICRGCPVRQECLEYAQKHRLAYGIWGGLSHRERQMLRRGDAA